MCHRWARVGDPTLSRGARSTGRASDGLRVIWGMSLWLIPRDVVGHIRGSVWWQHCMVHQAHVLVTRHLNRALPRLSGLRDATLN